MTESTSQGVFFLFALIATFLLSLIPFPSFKWKFVTFLLFALVVNCSFTATETVQRVQIASKASALAAHQLLEEQAVVQQRRHNSAQYNTTNANNHQNLAGDNRNYPTNQEKEEEKEYFPFEDATWFNGGLSVLWEILDAQHAEVGGLGPYISEMYGDMV
eukprot:CAMPEP_0170364392 /NCGR_PEP_ID=MMETSP0117_2-20130122/5348_1 /TAXON_ID=400756 /ORGANISM="Durinskia baltica, Strain CSIRO CS-38" /LENGTH=159 /DNA_ID=CAMNT_0010618887 /DNA_START=150 /DNA_END=625 /DNA_ORIENTATION=-